MSGCKHKWMIHSACPMCKAEQSKTEFDNRIDEERRGWDEKREVAERLVRIEDKLDRLLRVMKNPLGQ